MKSATLLHIARGWLIAMLISALNPGSTFAQAAISPAGLIAEQLATPGNTISSVTDFTAATDPDGLLGAPGQYIAKARFTDSAGVTGDVEVFGGARDAKTRLNGLAGGMVAGQEQDIAQNLVVLRLYNLTGDTAFYKAVLAVAVGAP